MIRILFGIVLFQFGLTAVAADFNFSSLKTLLDDSKAGTVEEFLPFLPDNYKKHFVLLYESKSLQTASFEFPRVIAYGAPDYQTTDRLLIAFQSDASASSNRPNTLEVMEWNPASASYQPYNIEFQGSGKGYQIGSTAVCSHCHMDPVRPNWTAYPFWPGVYGSGTYPADMFTFDQQREIHDKELDNIKLVLNNWRANPRTAALDSSTVPANLEGSIYDWAMGLTSRVGNPALIRMAHMLHDSPDYYKFKYAIYAGVAKPNQCDFSQFFPADLVAQLGVGIYQRTQQFSFLKDSFPNETSVNYSTALGHTSLWLMRSVKFSEFENEKQIITWLRFIFEGRGMGDNLQNMLGKPPIRQEVFSYDISSFGERIDSSIVKGELQAMEPDLERMTCDQLASASRTALQ